MNSAKNMLNYSKLELLAKKERQNLSKNRISALSYLFCYIFSANPSVVYRAYGSVFDRKFKFKISALVDQLSVRS